MTKSKKPKYSQGDRLKLKSGHEATASSGAYANGIFIYLSTVTPKLTIEQMKEESEDETLEFAFIDLDEIVSVVK